jgi:hypothetical protein
MLARSVSAQNAAVSYNVLSEPVVASYSKDRGSIAMSILGASDQRKSKGAVMSTLKEFLHKQIKGSEDHRHELARIIGHRCQLGMDVDDIWRRIETENGKIAAFDTVFEFLEANSDDTQDL